VSDARQVAVAFRESMTAASEIFANALDKLTDLDNADADVCCLIEEHHRKIQTNVESPVSEPGRAPKLSPSPTNNQEASIKVFICCRNFFSNLIPIIL